MNTETMITELKAVAEKHKNDKLFTFQTNITAMCGDIIPKLEQLAEYEAIGTVEECREARERQRVKDIIHNPDGGVDEDWLCPSCGRFCSPYTKHCQHCGQAVKVGDNL